MRNRQNLFYAKILLFGEYSVICNSMGLTIPFSHFAGQLKLFSDDVYTDQSYANNSNTEIKVFFSHLSSLQKSGNLDIELDMEQFNKDIKNGLYFESSIPQGYGIGSSGALCAAIYHEYAVNGIPKKRYLVPEDISRLKSAFAKMEDIFHGVSSGIDPLLSYINYPLLIKDKENIQTIQIPRVNLSENEAIFLINTRQTSKTEPLVKHFIENCSQPYFKRMVEEELIPTNNSCINTLLNGDIDSFYLQLSILSGLQLQHFKLMIPETFTNVWENGLNNELFYLKLCGSGGGGFLLGFTRSFREATSYFETKNLSPIVVFRKY